MSALPVISKSSGLRSAVRSACSCRPAPGIVKHRHTIAKSQLHNESPSVEIDLTSGLSKVYLPSLAGLSTLLATGAAHADELPDAAADASGAGGFSTGEAVLLLIPVLVYALFNLYRDRVNPQAKFLDYIYIMVFLAIVANLFSIVVYKTRFF